MYDIAGLQKYMYGTIYELGIKNKRPTNVCKENRNVAKNGNFTFILIFQKGIHLEKFCIFIPLFYSIGKISLYPLNSDLKFSLIVVHLKDIFLPP